MGPKEGGGTCLCSRRGNTSRPGSRSETRRSPEAAEVQRPGSAHGEARSSSDPRTRSTSRKANHLQPTAARVSGGEEAAFGAAFSAREATLPMESGSGRACRGPAHPVRVAPEPHLSTLCHEFRILCRAPPRPGESGTKMADGQGRRGSRRRSGGGWGGIGGRTDEELYRDPE